MKKRLSVRQFGERENVYFGESKMTFRNASEHIFSPFLAIEIAGSYRKKEVDGNTCCHSLKECYQSEKFLTYLILAKNGFTMSTFPVDKLVQCFLRASGRAFMLNSFSVTKILKVVKRYLQKFF